MTNPMKLTHRGAAMLLLLFCAGHTVGTFGGRSPAPEADSVLVAMRTVRFDFNGVDRTFYDIFFGHALLVSVYLFGSAFVAWFLASVKHEHWPAVAPMAWGLAVAQLVTATVAGMYFFAGPAVLSGLAGALLVIGNLRATALRRSSG
jgi:hypothetical protein